ncbi:MAG: hypothetical protein U1F25_18470 [Rubrivivax sp.]
MLERTDFHLSAILDHVQSIIAGEAALRGLWSTSTPTACRTG